MTKRSGSYPIMFHGAVNAAIANRSDFPHVPHGRNGGILSEIELDEMLAYFDAGAHASDFVEWVIESRASRGIKAS
jgi:hypothetical protein